MLHSKILPGGDSSKNCETDNIGTGNQFLYKSSARKGEYSEKKERITSCRNIMQYRDDMMKLTHRGPVTPYGNIDLGQHWLR